MRWVMGMVLAACVGCSAATSTEELQATDAGADAASGLGVECEKSTIATACQALAAHEVGPMCLHPMKQNQYGYAEVNYSAQEVCTFACYFLDAGGQKAFPDGPADDLCAELGGYCEERQMSGELNGQMYAWAATCVLPEAP